MEEPKWGQGALSSIGRMKRCKIRPSGFSLFTPLRLLAREQGSLIDKTDFVAKRVRAIETALAPGLSFNRSEDFGVRLFSYTTLVRFQILDGEVHMVGVWRCVPGVTIRPRIETSEDCASTVVVVPSWRDSHARLFQNSGIKGGGLTDA